MKTIACTLFLSMALCASRAKANSIHDIVGTSFGGIDPIDYYTDSTGQSLSFTGGDVHWLLQLNNFQTIDSHHIIGLLGETLVSGRPEEWLLWIGPAEMALSAVASQLEIEEFHVDVALEPKLVSPNIVAFLDITVPDTISTLPLLIAALGAACSFSRQENRVAVVSRRRP